MLGLVALAILTIFGVLTSVLLAKAGFYARLRQSRPIPRSEILDSWQRNDWETCREQARRSIALEPMDPFYLAFAGLSSLYEGLGKLEGEGREGLIEEAIVHLRKALVHTGSTARIPRAELEYALGKAYYFKGSNYYDQAVSCLESSLRDGYSGGDTREFLALAYSGLEDWENAVKSFEAALASAGRSDLLLISAAQAYRKKGEPDTAEKLLLETLGASSDILTREKARFMLTDLYYERGNRQAAEVQVRLILDSDPESAEAHYRLGLIYQDAGDPIRARAAWRKAVTIDPMHAASRQKLAEKL